MLALALALAGCQAAGNVARSAPPAASQAEGMKMIIPGTTVGRLDGWAISVGSVLRSTTYRDAQGQERVGPAALIGVFAQDGPPESEVRSKVGVGSVIQAGPHRLEVVRVGLGSGDEAFLEVAALPD